MVKKKKNLAKFLFPKWLSPFIDSKLLDLNELGKLQIMPTVCDCIIGKQAHLSDWNPEINLKLLDSNFILEGCIVNKRNVTRKF